MNDTLHLAGALSSRPLVNPSCQGKQGSFSTSISSIPLCIHKASHDPMNYIIRNDAVDQLPRF